MFGAFKKFGRLGGARSGSAWSERALWPLGAASPGLWIDGPSYPAACWKDSAGTTALSTVGTVLDSSNPVGLILDRKGGLALDKSQGLVLGPELVVNGDFSGGIVGWSVSGAASLSWDNSNSLRITETASSFSGAYPAALATVAGKTYVLTGQVLGGTGDTRSFHIGTTAGSAGIKANGTTVELAAGFKFLAVGPSTFITLTIGGNVTGDYKIFDNISVRELPGLHLSQATATSRPVASARVNLLTYSEDFSNAAWVKTETTVSSNAVVAPDGTTTADKLIPSAVLGAHYTYVNSVFTGVYSVYAKAGETSTLFMSFGDGYWLGRGASFDLSAGTFSVFSGASASITDAGGGWYRCTVYTPNPFRCFLTPGTSISFAGDGTSGLYLWGAQLNLGSTALPYQRVTTSSDYDASAGPTYLKFDGTDDALASATFAAGTLTSSMDCLIAVRRDSAANVVAGLYNAVADATKYFGMAESASGSAAVGTGAGTPTIWVDGTQLAGGTAVTRGTLHTALTVGSWHILELRGLDLSTWTATGIGNYTGYVLNGTNGAIQLFASGQDANRDKARARMAAYFGVTLA